MNKLRNVLSRITDKNKDKGFTLIELVIVVVIIGILTAIAIPSYGAIQHTTRANAVKSSVKDTYVSVKAQMAKGDDVPGGYPSKDKHIALAVNTYSDSGVSVVGYYRDDNGNVEAGTSYRIDDYSDGTQEEPAGDQSLPPVPVPSN